MVEICGKSSELIHGKHVSASAHGRIILLIHRLLFFYLLIFILIIEQHYSKYSTVKAGAF